MIFILLVTLLTIGIMYMVYMSYTRKSEPIQNVPIPVQIEQVPVLIESEQIKAPPFIPSNEFVGSKPGYVFYRSDEYGIGYHLDNNPSNHLPPGFKP